VEYLLERIKAGRKNTVTVRMCEPDLSGDFGKNTTTVRLLTTQDVLDATLAADRIFADAGVTVSLQNIKVYEAEKDVQNLYRACTDEDGQPLAANITEFRKLLTVVDKERLIDAYNKLDTESNPSVSTMSAADFDILVETIKKNPSTVSNVSNIVTLRRLVLFLASEQSNSQKDSGRTSQ
jgi:hypothetical protein